MRSKRVKIEFTSDAALVLYDWLMRFNQRADTDFADQAEERVLFDLEAMLEKALVAPLLSDYADLMVQARSAGACRVALTAGTVTSGCLSRDLRPTLPLTAVSPPCCGACPWPLDTLCQGVPTGALGAQLEPWVRRGRQSVGSLSGRNIRYRGCSAREPERHGVPVASYPIPERDRGLRQTCESPHRDLIGLLDLLGEGQDHYDSKHKRHQHMPCAVQPRLCLLQTPSTRRLTIRNVLGCRTWRLSTSLSSPRWMPSLGATRVVILDQGCAACTDSPRDEAFVNITRGLHTIVKEFVTRP